MPVMALYHGIITNGIYFKYQVFSILWHFFTRKTLCTNLRFESKNTAENATAELTFCPKTFSLCRRQASKQETRDISEAEASFLKA